MTLDFPISAFKAGFSVDGLWFSFDIVMKKSGQMDRNWTRRLGWIDGAGFMRHFSPLSFPLDCELMLGLLHSHKMSRCKDT